MSIKVMALDVSWMMVGGVRVVVFVYGSNEQLGTNNRRIGKKRGTLIRVARLTH